MPSIGFGGSRKVSHKGIDIVKDCVEQSVERGCVIVEAGIKGGSMEAGKSTLKMGENLYVPQYGEYPESALGNVYLLDIGAHLIRKDRLTHKAKMSQIFAS